MNFKIRLSVAGAVAATGLFANLALAQGTLADYQRGQELQRKSRGLVVNAPGPVNWIGDSDRFWYYRSVKGGNEFLLVDATTAAKKPAFDHDKLAAAISSASGGHYTGLTLPFAPAPGGRGGAGGGGRGGATPAGALTFIDHEAAITFGISGFLWKCTLDDYTCTKGDTLPAPTAGRGGGPEVDDSPEPTEIGGDPVDGLAWEPPSPQQDDQGGGRAGRGPTGCGPRMQARAQGQGRGGRGGRGAAAATPAGQAAEPAVCTSFDGKWEALIENYNVFLRPAGSSQPAATPPAADPATPGTPARPPAAVPLSFDGSEGNAYTLRSVAWSPDSKKLVAYHTRPGYSRLVHYIESSPADQVQPKLWTNATKPNATFRDLYQKPGDALDIAYPALFDIATKTEIEIDRTLIPNAYSLSTPVWWKDSRGFTFEYNQRGHQVYRVIEVDAATGKARAIIDEQSKTFIYYSALGPGLSAGRKYRHDLNDGKEIVWASERDGWEHLYLYDGVTGKVKNRITKGDWVVRNVDRVDDDKRQIWFEAGGMNPGEDPYFTHYYRIDFDGTGLTKLTDANGNHTVTFSPDRKYYVDTWSRVDLPPVAQLRRTEDQKVVTDLEKGDASALLAAGFHFPEVFVAKGRDGQTDIWGTIVRPMNFDANKKYPVIEQIYAGPQGSFVPKTFSAVSGTQALAELGFIVVQIDGMGTSNRSKAFHDVSFKNLGDAGFPDRILWHQAAAAKYPYYDISRVGIYGTSAGGQNSLGGVLFHPEFYKVVVTNSGCHDNRMDKIWWNEQWMGWPVGPEYGASSNVDNAYRLQGKALIVIGEMDGNVDPASSLQVVNALVKANKHFDMLYIPGQDHGVGVLNTQHYRDDYFVHNLLGVEPPDWNKVTLPPPTPRPPPVVTSGPVATNVTSVLLAAVVARTLVSAASRLVSTRLRSWRRSKWGLPFLWTAHPSLSLFRKKDSPMRLTATFFLLSLSLSAQQEFPLWPSGAPGPEGKTAKEVDEPPNLQHGYFKITNVHTPSVTVFLPASDKSTGAAMVIAPGGGHQFLNFDQEGTYVAQYLTSIGVTAFVLKYRLAREPGSTYKIEEHALRDAQRAIRLIRSRAGEWHVNPARVGIMGFSAGGEVAALASTRFDAGQPDAADPIDRQSSRPDFDALIYPGIRAETYTIPKDMPVTFLLCADNDRGPSTALSVLYPMLKAAGIKTEVHVYATGGHGFGINPNTKSHSPVATTWQLRLGDWLKDIGL